jgi:hypothetical protein
MKKFAYFVVALALLSLACGCSTYAQTPINVGFRAGLNLGNATLDPDVPSGVDKSFRTGLIAGGYGELGFAEDMFVTAEILYVQEGMTFSAGGTDVTYKLDYLEIPLAFKYKFALENSQFKPFVLAGPVIGINMSAKEEDTDIKDYVESTMFGLQFGVGAQYQLDPSMALLLDGTFGYGLTNVAKDMGDQKINPWSIGIKAGLIFSVN